MLRLNSHFLGFYLSFAAGERFWAPSPLRRTEKRAGAQGSAQDGRHARVKELHDFQYCQSY